MFKLYFREKALKTLKRMERKSQFKVNFILNDLESGRFTKLDIQKIRGTKGGHRLRLGRWRILFTLFLKEKRIEIVDIFLKKGKKDYSKRKKLIRE